MDLQYYMFVSDLNGPYLEIVGIVPVEGEGQMVLYLEAAHKGIPGRKEFQILSFSLIFIDMWVNSGTLLDE